MKPNSFLATASACLLLGSLTSLAQPAFPPPPSGWTYIYNGTQLTVGDPGTGWTSLDGTWTHDNGSDEWDGSPIGGTFSTGGFGIGNGPGGTILGTQGGVDYLRIQVTGDPRDYGYPDPSNRKIYFGHNIGSDIDPIKAQTIMRDGVTLTFRARIPTLAKAGPPLDPLHRDGQQASGVQPYPDSGDGYVTSDGGKGNFVIREGGNGLDVPAAAIAFSLTQTNDTTGGNPATGQAGFAGLTFNEFNGNQPSASVNFGQGSRTNLVPFDPTEWHELYIVLRDDPADIGTHEAFIFLDGNVVPNVFKITGGTGSDLPDSFLAMGGSATPQNFALDVDWFGYKDEAVFPPGALLPPSIFGFVPANRAAFHPAASGLSFSASALMPTNTLPASGFKVILNGQDVSSQLVLTGNNNSQSRTATFNGLQPNSVYSAIYIVTDSGGLSTTNDVSFDTFVEATTVVVEAEDYNYGGGEFFDNPPPGLYAGTGGLQGIDFHDSTLNSFGTYRFDEVDTATTADVARSKFTSVGATDYQIGGIITGEWLNYTRTLSSPAYQLWVRAATTAAQPLRVDRVTGDRTQPNQTLQFVGTLDIPRTGTLNLFDYFQLKDIQGRPISIPAGAVTTLRLTAPAANGDLTLNYLILVPATATTDSLTSVSPLPGAVAVRADAPIEATLYDGSTPISAASVKLLVGGNEVAATVTKAGSVTSVKYTPPAIWSPATTVTLSLIYNDGADRTNNWSFTTANYPVLTPNMKVTGANTRGFVWRVHQNEANQDANMQKVLNALSGALGLPNLADPNSQGPASAPGTPANPGNGMMTFNIPTVINVGQDTFGNFGSFIPDEQMPGIPGLNFSTDGIAVEITTFITLPSGLITMGVNSDDGFRTLTGFLNHTPLILDQFDGGRSSTDSIFQFAAQEAGVYAFRTLYVEGGGNANLEWFIVKPDGTRVLVNDTDNGGPASFQQGTIPTPPVDVTVKASLNASGQVVIEWSAGTLESATEVGGAYSTVTGATSPYTVNPADAPRRYFRVRVQ
ncbi:MAG: hypothetical protein KJ070_05175 [Verrucomicrobia bacterium]|nr:hypothetical protein [Verrucomicrobiota bacterium]